MNKIDELFSDLYYYEKELEEYNKGICDSYVRDLERTIDDIKNEIINYENDDKNELSKDYKIVIDDEENYIGYVKDLRKFLHNEIEKQVKDWNNYEDSICNMAHILYVLKCNYADDDLIKISECAMDEYGIKIEELEAK